MSAKPEIIEGGSIDWENRHQTFREKQDNYYDAWNADTNDLIAGYNDMTGALQQLIKSAASDGKNLRAFGGGWSWSKIATTTLGRMINTKALNWKFSISPASVSSNYVGSSQDLVFAQCGNSVQELNNWLKKKLRSLKTSGASNGQTIAGALSTGTHGSAFDFGAIPEYVVGIHLILSPTKHIWLERKSYPVMTDDFANRINAEPVRDDNLFYAALVSFGSFGFIHGVLIETEPIYLLECHRQRLPLDPVLFRLMESLDFSNISILPNGNERPYHFQTLINQFDVDNGAYVTTMYKRPYRINYSHPVTDSNGHAPGDDAPAFIGLLTEVVPTLVPFVVNKLIGASYKPYSNTWGTLGEIFSNTDTRGKVLSAAIGIPLDQVLKVKDILIQLNQSKGPFAGVFAFRYVKSSKATMSFTRFSPITCVVELDGVTSESTLAFYREVWNELDRMQISYTFHWGKINGLNSKRMKSMYGAKADDWIAARHSLLDATTISVFNNPLITEWGLHI